MMDIRKKLAELNVGHCYGWGILSEDEIKYSPDGFVTYLVFDDCTLPQFNDVITIIFDDIFNGKFEAKFHDFYHYIKEDLVRNLLDKLLDDCSEDNQKIVVKALAFIDSHYGSE